MQHNRSWVISIINEWYKKSFGQDYLIVYRHRDFAGAMEEVKAMVDWLQLDPGASILDLCCGTGRHALALANFGYRVTGLDLSAVLLNEAKKNDPQGIVTWVHGDMRHIPEFEPFDAVVNLFTSFGYFEQDAENEQVLKGMADVLKSDGKFIVDFLNPEYVKRHLVPYSERVVDTFLIVEERSIENDYVQKKITIRERSGAERHYMERVKLYGKSFFAQAMSKYGLEIDALYGDYAKQPYEEATSPRLIIVGTKQR